DGYCRIRRGRERPKPVEAAIRGYPDAVFAVFEHHPDDVARQTIGAAKAIDACAMQMKHTRGRSDPECAVAILKDLPCQERLGRRREQKGCGPPSDKLRDAPIYDREEFAARAFDPGGTGIPGAKHERRIGPPSPSAILGPHPQLAPGVLEDGGHLSAPSTVLSDTVGTRAANRTQQSSGPQRPPAPTGPGLTITGRSDGRPLEPRMPPRRFPTPTGESRRGSYPQNAVTAGEQCEHWLVGGQSARRRRPRYGAAAVEANQSRLSTQP